MNNVLLCCLLHAGMAREPPLSLPSGSWPLQRYTSNLHITNASSSSDSLLLSANSFETCVSACAHINCMLVSFFFVFFNFPLVSHWFISYRFSWALSPVCSIRLSLFNRLFLLPVMCFPRILSSPPRPCACRPVDSGISSRLWILRGRGPCTVTCCLLPRSLSTATPSRFNPHSSLCHTDTRPEPCCPFPKLKASEPRRFLSEAHLREKAMIRAAGMCE